MLSHTIHLQLSTYHTHISQMLFDYLVPESHTTLLLTPP